MPQIEFEGKNIDDAVEIACKKLNCPKDDLKFDIISSGSTGIFGLIGAKKAKIRIIQSKVVQETSHSQSGGSSYSNRMNTSEGIKSLVDEAFNDTPPKPVKDTVKPGKPKPVEKAQTVEKVQAVEKPKPEPKKTFTFPKEPIESGKAILEDISNSITDGSTVTIDQTNEKIIYRIEGGNTALLIGKRGQTLDAMQYLVDKIVNKQCEERVRIQVDIEGYLENRKNSLESLALRLAEKAKKTGKPSTISQMTAHDRRIVHLALKDDHTVKTRSIGEGYYRRLVIFPKKRKYRKNTKHDNPDTK